MTMWKLGVLLLLEIFFLGCRAGDPAPRAPGLKVLEAAMTSAEQGPAIRGAIRNDSLQPFAYVEVDITLIDPSGRPIAPTVASMEDLKPGAVWCWTVPCCDNIADFKIARVLAR